MKCIDTGLGAMRIQANAYAKQRPLFNRISSNFSWSLLSEVGGKGVLFLVNVLLARRLEVENYGLITYAQTIASYFWLAAELGINMYGSREIAKDRANASEIVNVLLTVRIVSGFIIFIIFLVISHLMPIPYLQKLVMAGSAFYILTRSINVDWVMRGFESFHIIAWGNIATFLSMFIFMFLFIRNKNDAVLASYTWSLSYLLGGCVLLFFLTNRFSIKFKPVLRPSVWLSHLKESIHFTLSGSLLILYQYLPILLLGISSTAYEVGLFSSVYKLTLSIVYALSILPLSLYPVFSELFIKDKVKFHRLHRMYTSMSLLLGFIVVVIGNLSASKIVLFLYGASYLESVIFFKITLIYLFLFCFRNSIGIVIAATNLQKYYVFASLSAVISFVIIFKLLTNLFMTPAAVAASVALVCAEFCLIIILLFIWKRFMRNQGQAGLTQSSVK
jgi:O-antigen/teichoic acid export membrane protein